MCLTVLTLTACRAIVHGNETQYSITAKTLNSYFNRSTRSLSRTHLINSSVNSSILAPQIFTHLIPAHQPINLDRSPHSHSHSNYIITYPHKVYVAYHHAHLIPKSFCRKLPSQPTQQAGRPLSEGFITSSMSLSISDKREQGTGVSLGI